MPRLTTEIHRVPLSGYISRQQTAGLLGIAHTHVSEAWHRSQIALEPPIRVVINDRVEIWFHEESARRLHDSRNPPVPDGYILVTEAAELIGCETVTVAEWCKRRNVPVIKIIRLNRRINTYHRATIESLGRASVAISSQEDTENIKALRQMLQHSNDMIEAHPARKRALQEQAARHLGLSLTSYQILEASGKPLPMDLFIKFQSLRRIPRRCFRSGCNDYK